MNNSRDMDILERMVQYCDEIALANTQFGCSLEVLNSNSTYKNAVYMCIFQIGELTTHLSDDFRAAHTQIPWQRIKSMRNVVAHRYGEIEPRVMIATITERIPELRAYCAEILRQYEQNLPAS